LRFDLKVFFSVVGKDPVEVDTADVLAFVAAQREPRRGTTVVRIEDGERGLAARTIKRRLATISGLFEYLLVRGDTPVTRNPVPRGLAMRRTGARVVRGVPLIRAPRTLPRVIDPQEANAFLSALRTHRDRAMVEAMLLGGLRRCEVPGLRLTDVHPCEKRVFIAEGKGGHQRIVPVSGRFFTTVASYLDNERPRDVHTDRVFVVLKGRRRPAVDSLRVGRGRGRGPAPRRDQSPDLPPAAAHLLYPAPGSGDGVGGDPGSGWAPLHRVHPHLPAPGRRLAGRGVPSGQRGDRRADLG
jgi:integrase/recombinase XerD